MSEPLVVTRITVTELVDEHGATTTLDIDPDTPLVSVLGLLRLAEDTAIRTYMGEAPEP